MNNFFQKPLGILTAVTAAIGGPYAAFETDFGTSLRRSLVSANISDATRDNNTGFNPEGLSRLDSSDPYSLRTDLAQAAYQTSPSGFGSTYPGQMAPTNSAPVPVTQPNYPYQSSAPSGPLNATHGKSVSSQFPSPAGLQSSVFPPPSPYPDPTAAVSFGPSIPTGGSTNSINAAGQMVTTTYGPATVFPVGPSVGNVGFGQPVYSANPIETRSGPASVVAGGTDQLWDYTLGTPTLPQLQQQPNVTVGGGAVLDLREVLRFDITPGWLPQRFARVTTVTSNVKMDGLRVPLISGTQTKDIAGSLTYFFDSTQSLKRIQLHGMTGDPSELANLMVQFYGLQPEASLGGKLFTARWNNRVTSVFQVSPAPIIYAGADHSKYILFLELNQPSNQYGLSDEASERLRMSQATQRW